MNPNSRSASVILSDDDKVLDALSEARRELLNCYDRIEHLQHVVRGVIFMVSKMPPELREVIATHPSIIDAHEVLL